MSQINKILSGIKSLRMGYWKPGPRAKSGLFSFCSRGLLKFEDVTHLVARICHSPGSLMVEVKILTGGVGMALPSA